jgi:hypothetical protein
MTIRTLALESGATTIQDHRLTVGSLIAPAGAVTRRQGLFPTALDDGCTLTAVSAMVAAIGPFAAVVQGTTSATQGTYIVTSDAAVNITFDAGEAAVDRTDRVILRIRDNTFDGSGSQTATVEILKGQSSGAATTLPDSSLLLWEVEVPAGASAGTGGINFSTQSVDVRTFTAAAGGAIPVYGSVELGALADLPAGQVVVEYDVGRLYTTNDLGVLSMHGSGFVSAVADIATAAPNALSGQIFGVSSTESIALKRSTDVATIDTTWTVEPSTFIDAATTAPTKGAGSTWLYQWMRQGDVIEVQWNLVVGSGWSDGSGTYYFPLPESAATYPQAAGAAWILDLGSMNRSAVVHVDDLDPSYAVIHLDGSSTAIGSTGPDSAGWDAGDIITASLRYRPA